MASKLRWVVSIYSWVSKEQRLYSKQTSDIFHLTLAFTALCTCTFLFHLPSLLSFPVFTACVLCFKLSDDEPQAKTGRRVKEPEFNDRLQGCDSHITWQTVTTFRLNLLPPSSRQNNKPCGREVRNYLPELTASHLKRVQLSYKPPGNSKPGSKTYWWLPSSRADSIENIITRLRAGQSGVRILSGARDLSLLQIVQNSPGTHPGSCTMGTRILSWG